MIFDFNRLEVQKLKAKIGESGSVNAKGALSLFREDGKSEKGLKIEMKSIAIKNNTSSFKTSSDLLIKGTVIKPLLGGNITINKGSISTKRSRTSDIDDNMLQRRYVRSNEVFSKQLPEQNWD